MPGRASSRRRSSRSMASLMRSSLVSSPETSASIRSVTPSASGNVILTGNSFFRPTRDRIAYVRNWVKRRPFRMYDIDPISYIRYPFNRTYDWTHTMSPKTPHEQARQNRRSELKRSVVVAGRKTSVTLEVPFWEALQDIARERAVTATGLVNEINAHRSTTNLSAAIRIYVLDYYRAQVRSLRATRSQAS